MKRELIAERAKWGILRRLNRHHFSVLREFSQIPGGELVLRRFWRRRLWDNYGLATGCSGEELLFIHVPKCAGTSIARMLLDRTLPCVPAYPYAIANPDRFRRAYSFAVLRDPAQQILSTLFHLERSEWAQPEDHRFFVRERIGEQTVDELLERFSDDTGFRKRLFTETWIGRTGMIMRPHEFVQYRGRVIVKRLYAFERLELLVKDLSERLGHSLTLDHHNPSKLQGEAVAIDPHVIRRLRLRFTRDYALWDRLTHEGGTVDSERL